MSSKVALAALLFVGPSTCHRVTPNDLPNYANYIYQEVLASLNCA